MEKGSEREKKREKGKGKGKGDVHEWCIQGFLGVLS